MAKGKKTGGRDFAHGNPGGPGQPPLPPELKATRRLTKGNFELIANKYVWSSEAELEAALKDEATAAIEKLLVTIMLAGIKNGDQGRAEFFLQRLVGKVVDKVEVTLPKPFIVQRLDGSTIEMGAKLAPGTKQLGDGEAE